MSYCTTTNLTLFNLTHNVAVIFFLKICMHMFQKVLFRLGKEYHGPIFFRKRSLSPETHSSNFTPKENQTPASPAWYMSF